MKKILATLSVALLQFVCFGQTPEEFVEVVEYDTIRVVPDVFTFSVMIKKDEEGFAYPAKRAGGSATGVNQKEQRIRQIIAQQKIDTIADAGDLSLLETVLSETLGKKFTLRFTTTQQLAAFLKAAEAVKGIMGTVTEKKSNQLEKYKEMLTKRLLEKAFSDASYISVQNKKTIGKLLQVKEEGDGDDKGGAGWTSYPPLSAMVNYYAGEYETNIILVRKLRVRYAWQ